MRKHLGSIISLSLWLTSTALMLITLSGETLSKALVISAIAFVINILAIFVGVAMEEE
jgi:uncharacterized membrane protein